MVVLCGIAVIIIASLYGGYKKGMVKMVLSCIALLATMIIVGVLSPIVTKAVKNTDSYESVLDSTEKRLVKEGVFKEGNIEDIIEKLNVPDEIKNYILLGPKGYLKASVAVLILKEHLKAVEVRKCHRFLYPTVISL